jgi:acyl carrier protein
MNESERAKLRSFIIKQLQQSASDAPFEDSDSLFMAGRLSSLDAVELILFLESDFEADLSRVDFDQTQIDTVDAIAGVVDACRGQTACAR